MDLSKTPVLYKVKRNKNIMKAIIANAVMIFFFFSFFIRCYHIILSAKNRTKIKNRYKIEYPKIVLAFFASNLFFL